MALTDKLLESKVGEVPKVLKENVSRTAAKSWWGRFSQNYARKYFGRGSNARVTPLFHAIAGVGLVGYVMSFGHLRMLLLR